MVHQDSRPRRFASADPAWTDMSQPRSMRRTAYAVMGGRPMKPRQQEATARQPSKRPHAFEVGGVRSDELWEAGRRPGGLGKRAIGWPVTIQEPR